MFGFNPPAYVLGLKREGQPLSLVNAFEKPVYGQDGYVKASEQKLDEHWAFLKKAYNLDADVEAKLPSDDLDSFLGKLV